MPDTTLTISSNTNYIPIRILGIDPGETCGWATMDVEYGGAMRLTGYGTIGLIQDTWRGNLWEIYSRIMEFSCDQFVMEQGIQIARVTTSPKANHVRGIVYLCAEEMSLRDGGVGFTEYHPSHVKAAIRDSKLSKADMRKWVSALFGLPALIKSPDMADAIAVCATYALRELKAKFPHDVVMLPSRKGGARQQKQTVLDLTPAEIKDGLKSGKLYLDGRKVKQR